MKFLLQGKVDILVMNKIKLNYTFPKNQFLIEGYSKPFRLDKNRNGGGLLVYITEDIPCKELKSHSFAEDIEGTFIKINVGKHKNGFYLQHIILNHNVTNTFFIILAEV